MRYDSRQQYRRYLMHLVLLLVTVFPVYTVQAAQQFQGLCSYIKMEIKQELALERIGFLATLEVTNNEGDAVLTDFSSSLTFTGYDSAGNPFDASDLFFVQPPELAGITDINGSGKINPGETATISWFIIPKISAGGESPEGIAYDVGAELAGSLYGNPIDPSVLVVIPDSITVKPEPQLDITYFQPRDVDGDNPFTKDIVETPVPFTLGVLVRNVGFGRANKVVIASEQPKIVEDLENLLVVPKLIGARVNDEPTDFASLTVNLGDIEPGSCRKGAWDMITTLSGEFTEFNARYTHASELGGEATSVIKSINAYFIVHEVLNDQPGRDGLLDFLATTDKTQTDLIPDTLYESDCNVLPVNRLTDVSVTGFSGGVATLHAVATIENWNFIRIDDPAQARLPIESVVRSDGKVLNPNNYWTNIRYERNTNAELTYLNIFDNVALGAYDYTVTYKLVGSDTTAPATTLMFSGPYETTATATYVTPDTQLFFIVNDDSPVGSYYRVDSGSFKPAYPFKLSAGTYTLEYYSEDSYGNVETTHTTTIIVSENFPGFANLQASVDELLIAGDSVSVRPTVVDVSFTGNTEAASLSAVAEVYQGVYAWPTLQGVPASPTADTSAVLTVGGLNVDYYQYQTGTTWSPEYPVTQPITLNALSGTVRLTVRARSQYGSYSTSSSDYLTVSWQVDPTAPPVRFSTPLTPSNSVNTSIQVGNVDLYRWTIDAGYYRAEAPTSQLIVLNNLTEGGHVLSVIGKTGTGPWQDQDSATVANWLVDRDYGYRLPLSARVYTQNLGKLTQPVSVFSWNGRAQNGAPVEPGWYTIKLTITDGLGRSSSSLQLVKVGNLIPGSRILPTAATAPHKEAHGKGNWAVWQDQRNGSWNIFAQNLYDPLASETAITTGNLNQERPRTDGEYVVWQARQADGNWDILVKKLGTADPAIAVTQTIDRNEINPVIEWPWVVYQTRPVSDPTAPWQLYVSNLITGVETVLHSGIRDQLDPEIDQQRVVWQDFRDVGPGEIYFKDLVSGQVRRITDNPAGQYHPVIENQWIVWEDNRNLQVDLYGYNLNRGVEVQLTNTPEDETRPRLNEHWVVYEEDLAGEQKINLRLLSLYNQASIQLTNAASNKEKPSLLAGKLLWTDQPNGFQQVLVTEMPDLQPVFNNRNIVAITPGMLNYISKASDLLSLWQREAGVVEITRFSQLLPTLVSETLSWTGSGVSGTDFTLSAGDFLWVKFDSTRILDFASSDCAASNLPAGTSVISSSCFPDDYRAYQLIRDLGMANVRAVRALDANTGRWTLTSVVDGRIVGENFHIPNVSVVLIEMVQPVSNWRPQP